MVMYGACPHNAFVCVKFYFSGISDLNSNADADVSAIFVLRIKQIERYIMLEIH